MTGQDVIRFVDVQKRFGAHEVLRGVSLTVRRGSVHFILGPSGAGKSVLIKQLVGLLRPDAGEIWLDDDELSRADERRFFRVRERCQLIFQQATLFEQLTVLENVAMPVRKRHHLSRAAAEARARVALGQVHAEAISERLPSTLGVGVQKRVAIARALALAPQVLLYDEPTTSLDPVAARRTDRLIAETSLALGLTSVVVSHDLTSVATIAERVTFLHDGRVRFDGTPAELFASADPIVRRFIGPAGREVGEITPK